MATRRATTRRTGTARTGGRSESVVDRVIAATLAELSRVGYEAMRVEDVAALSGVNKTTIYRRWPTKVELLTSAIGAAADTRVPPIDTGSLRADLRASLLTASTLTPIEQGVLRVIQVERALPAVEAFAQRMRDELREQRIALVMRGIARGELPVGTDAALVVDLVSAPVQLALLFNERMDAKRVDRVLDIVLAGAAHDARAQPAKKKRTRARSGTR
jgi:AcrR family transcriptional regulator